MTMTKHTPGPWCGRCGGDAGRLNENGEHNLCAARAALGLLTASLGMRCSECGGRGTAARGGVFLSFDLGPATIRRSIEAQFPPCPTCGGTGALLARLDG